MKYDKVTKRALEIIEAASKGAKGETKKKYEAVRSIIASDVSLGETERIIELGKRTDALKKKAERTGKATPEMYRDLAAVMRETVELAEKRGMPISDEVREAVADCERKGKETTPQGSQHISEAVLQKIDALLGNKPYTLTVDNDGNFTQVMRRVKGAFVLNSIIGLAEEVVENGGGDAKMFLLGTLMSKLK